MNHLGMGTYEEYDQNDDKQNNSDVDEKLRIRVVDLVKQGLR